MIRTKPKYKFTNIRNRVDAAESLQEAGEDDKAEEILEKLGSELSGDDKS